MVDEKKPQREMTRRQFVGATGAALTMGALSGVYTTASAAPESQPVSWDAQADVVVIGSGFSGLAAAHEAKKAGASVILLEKMPMPGGNSIINGGVFAVAGSPKQKAQGIEDSPELMLQDMLKAGLYLNHQELARMVAEKSLETAQWTVDELGVKYEEKVVHLGGHSVPRSYKTYNSSGSAIVNQQIAKLEEMGVKVETRTMFLDFVRSDAGRVIGVKVKSGYRFPKASSGKIKTIKANRGVVMASGGFSQDIRFRTIQDPRLTKDVDSTNQPGATAEAMLATLMAGGTLVQPSWIQLGPWTSPDEKGMGIGYVFNAMSAFVYGVMVDPATGKRFVNELANRKIRADAVIKTGHPCVGIADAEGAKASGPFLEKTLKKGVVKKFDSIAALAKAYAIPLPALNQTIETYNKAVAAGNDSEFGKYLQKDAKPLIAPPFYACRVWPKVHHTMGGVLIDASAAVIDMYGKPISGLYAAGEVAGGIHGAVRLGSVAVVDCLVFGRIAGQSAAAAPAWR